MEITAKKKKKWWLLTSKSDLSVDSSVRISNSGEYDDKIDKSNGIQ